MMPHSFLRHTHRYISMHATNRHTCQSNCPSLRSKQTIPQTDDSLGSSGGKQREGRKYKYSYQRCKSIFNSNLTCISTHHKLFFFFLFFNNNNNGSKESKILLFSFSLVGYKLYEMKSEGRTDGQTDRQYPHLYVCAFVHTLIVCGAASPYCLVKPPPHKIYLQIVM